MTGFAIETKLDPLLVSVMGFVGNKKNTEYCQPYSLTCVWFVCEKVIILKDSHCFSRH